MIFRFIHDHQADFPVAVVCHVLRVSRSGYYAWSKRPESRRSRENRELSQEIAEIHQESKGIYGSPKVHKELRRRGKRHGKNRIARLMRKDGLYAKTKRKFRVTTDSSHSQPAASNLLNREFNPALPNQAGLATSPISGPLKAGFTWQSSWICSPAPLSAGLWPSG